MSHKESYYPAHASLPVEQLTIPGPTAWATGAEMMAQLMTDLKAERSRLALGAATAARNAFAERWS